MATIKDVAKKANVSVATVSRVLNNSGYVNQETRKLVEQAIQDLHYVPNELARSLYKKQSKIIGLVVPHLSTHFFSELIERIEEYFSTDNFKLMIFNVREDLSHEEKVLQVFNQYNIDGLFIITHIPEIEAYKKLDIPIIMIDHKSDDFISISSNNIEGGRLAAEHLVENGCQNVLHIRGPSVLLTVQDRSEGFNEVIDRYGYNRKCLDLDFRKPDINAIQNFIQDNPEYDGIFCDSDFMAFTTIRAIHLLGRNVPKDYQVIGFDNIELAEVYNPTLTTIQQNIDLIAKHSFEKMIALINGKKDLKKHYSMPVTLIKRETTSKKAMR